IRALRNDRSERWCVLFSVWQPWEMGSEAYALLPQMSPLWAGVVSIHREAVKARAEILRMPGSWCEALLLEGSDNLRDSVFGWSRTQFLDADWCRDYAMRTMRVWLYDTESRSRRLLAESGVSNNWAALVHPARFLDFDDRRPRPSPLPEPPSGIEPWDPPREI